MATRAPEASARRAGAVAVEARPVPRQLATPTDLDTEQVAAVTEVVNGLIADAFALYVKTKNFHWHLAGSRFRDYHLMFDEQAEMLLDSLDVLAERVRRIGGTTIRSVGHVGRLQSIDDDNPPGSPGQDGEAHLVPIRSRAGWAAYGMSGQEQVGRCVCRVYR